MAKLKTRKSISKRIHKTKSGKLLKRTAGQDHFNSKESGKTKRNKRRDKQVSDSHAKTIRRAMPYA